MNEEICLLRVTGRVQGVFYRQTTRSNAQQLGLSGFVRNCDDGSVEALVIGDRSRIDELVAFCRRGPERARVDDLILQKLDETAARSHLQLFGLSLEHFRDDNDEPHGPFLVVK